MEIFKHIVGLLLLAVVIKGFDFNDLERKLNRMARRGEKIYDMFKPVEYGTIGRGGHGFVFQGINVERSHPVAMKFVPVEEREIADLEFKMYGYLNAINRTNVEKFGISSLYYYQEWEGFMLSVLPLFDGGDINSLSWNGNFHHTNPNLSINSLILFRDFVMQSKYIHSRGIRHNSIKPGNFVVQSSSSRVFMIDFTSSSKFSEQQISGTWPYIPRLVLTEEVSKPKSEWESFVYFMAYINRIELGWLFQNPFEGPGVSDTQAKSLAAFHFINDTDRTISEIENAPIACPVLKRVFVLFAKHALKNQDALPAYDKIYDRIVKEIERNFESPYFTWLDDNQRFYALNDHGRCREITDVPAVPRSLSGFNYQEYPLDFFPRPIRRRRSLLGCVSNQ